MPTIYGDLVIWGMVYYCYTHIITFVAKLAMVQVGSITCKSWFTMGLWLEQRLTILHGALGFFLLTQLQR